MNLDEGLPMCYYDIDDIFILMRFTSIMVIHGILAFVIANLLGEPRTSLIDSYFNGNNG